MATDAYLKLEGIAGDAVAAGFEKWIEIENFSWAATAPTMMGHGAGGMSGGRVDISAFNVVKRVDAATPILFQYCCTGKHFPSGTVVLTKAGGKGQDVKFLQYDFKEVFVAGLQMNGQGHADTIPMDSVSFSFGEVQISYTPQDNKGNPGSPVRASYNVALHK